MLNKIFLAVFVIATIGLVVLTFLAYSQLQSIGFAPQTIIENFNYFSGINWAYLWIASIALLVFANVIMWTNRKAWALWLTFIFFSFAIVSNMWWLNNQAFAYKKQNSLWEGGFDLSILGAAFFIVIAGIGIFFNQFVTFRLRDKMFKKDENLKAESLPVPQNTIETDV